MSVTGTALQPFVVEAVRQRLESIARHSKITVVWAVESGSRAWGFPSPDSDYDCRFLFVRTLADYLTPWPRKDTIEHPIEDDLDLVGWDLGKALALLLKGNAALTEWLTSPLVYAGDEIVRDRLLDLTARFPARSATVHHYLSLGEGQRQRHLSSGNAVPIKKIFYAVRPAAALRWLIGHSDGVPPMELTRLLAECDAPPTIQRLIADLTEQKARTVESERVPVPPELMRWMEAAFAAARSHSPVEAIDDRTSARAAAEQLFRDAVLQQRR